MRLHLGIFVVARSSHEAPNARVGCRFHSGDCCSDKERAMLSVRPFPPVLRPESGPDAALQ